MSSTETAPALPITASLSPAAVKRLTRGMTPIQHAQFFRARTLHPEPDQIGTSLYRVQSSRTSELYTVDTEAKTCTCIAGQKAREAGKPTPCWHYWYCRTHEQFGPYEFGIRRQGVDARYEVSTGDDPRHLPEPYMNPEQWRAYARREA